MNVPLQADCGFLVIQWSPPEPPHAPLEPPPEQGERSDVFVPDLPPLSSATAKAPETSCCPPYSLLDNCNPLLSFTSHHSHQSTFTLKQFSFLGKLQWQKKKQNCMLKCPLNFSWKFVSRLPLLLQIWQTWRTFFCPFCYGSYKGFFVARNNWSGLALHAKLTLFMYYIHIKTYSAIGARFESRD